MKSNWLIIMLVIVAGSTINLGSTLRYGNPSIEFINNNEFGGKNGDVFIYSIKFVITSYSIHYTKLYDDNIIKDKFKQKKLYKTNTLSKK